MGNNTSSDGSTVQRPVVRPFSRNGALGLSKAELEKRCQPSGLYPSCKWEEKAIRRLISDGRLAARLKGTENRLSPFDRECPICFLHYTQVNVSQCCRAHLCTECYLQVRPQKERSSACPFCNNGKLQVTVAQKMGIDDIQEREEEEQRVIAATIRARAQDGQECAAPQSEGSESSNSTFGSTLQQIIRARSESLGDISERTDSEQLASLALTPAERHALEQEMRAQHSHPLARLVEAEAEERRLQNEREYFRMNSGRIRERYTSELLRMGINGGIGGVPTDDLPRGLLPRADGDASVPPALTAMTSGQRRVRDWNQIVDAFESGGHGEVQSLDDLVVLEAAILLSMEEESRRNQQEGVAARTTFDAASHAREGFPLVHQFLNSRVASEEEGGAGDEDAMQTSVRSSGRPVRRRSSLLQGRLRRLSSSASMSMRSMTEDEQMALAIAASLREIGTQPANGTEGRTEQQASPTGANETMYYGRPVAVGIAAENGAVVRPAVGIMADDEETAGPAVRPAVGIMADDDDDTATDPTDPTVRPAVGIMVDDSEEAVRPRPAVGIMVNDSPVRHLGVGVMAGEDPESTECEDSSCDRSGDAVSAAAADVQPAAKNATRNITSGDIVSGETSDVMADDEEDDEATAGESTVLEVKEAGHTTTTSSLPQASSDKVEETNDTAQNVSASKNEDFQDGQSS